jgi:1,4-dihydroxy-2-naphthoate octaprenyltransferase
VTATTIHFNLSLVLFAVAVALFVLAAIPKFAKAWFIPIGLACFAGAFLAQRLAA